MKEIKLKYDGRWNWIENKPRQWTILNHFIDANGRDRYEGSFMESELVKLLQEVK